MPKHDSHNPGVPRGDYQAALLEAVEQTADGLVLTAPGGEVVYANGAARRLLGAALSGAQLSEIAEGTLGGSDGSPAGDPGSGDLWSTVQLEDRLIEVHKRRIDRNGVLCTLTTLSDVTARIDTERSLRARIAFENLVISVAASFITLSPDQVDEAIDSALARLGRAAAVDRAYVYRLNKTSMTLSNVWAAEETAGRWKNKELPYEGFEQRLVELRQNRPVLYQITEELADGTKRPRSSVCVPMLQGNTLKGFVGFDALWEAVSWRDEIVQLLKLVGFVFATTLARRRAQIREHRAYASLEQKVFERTAELRSKQAELARSEKLASLGQLVAGVAHEVNTPLGAMKSNNDVLVKVLERIDRSPLSKKDSALLQTAQDTLTVSREAVLRIEKIVGSLRQFARLDQAERGTVDLHQGIESTLTLLQHGLKHRVDVVRDYGSLPLIECYPNRLNQVFMNLLVNANQAIADKGTITITTRAQPSSVTVEIKDTGAGIAENDLPRVFDPGFTTKGVGVGTGLGLSIVYQIVEDHRGTVEVVSQLGKGTRFKVTLPLTLPAANLS